MSGDVIITVTLNAALHVAYTTGDLAAEGISPVSRPSYRAGGRGVTVARVLRAFGHDVLAAEDRDHVDLAVYERLLDAVRVEPSAR
jgi:fructose-1-phosphate kinase PfkB-like protein